MRGGRVAMKPSWTERVAFYFAVLLPWGLFYEGIVWLGPAPDAFAVLLPGEQELPVIEWTEAIYASTYLMVLLAPLLAPTRAVLRTLVNRGLLATALVFPIYLCLPIVAPPRPFVPETWLGERLADERALDTAAAAFPSFHVIWALIAAEAIAARWPRAKWWVRGWAVAVAVSCVTTGMHLIVDVIAGFATFALLVHAERLWELARRGAERVANSWREWRWGRMRVINHGLYAGGGTAVACAIAGCLVGPAHLPALVAVTISGLVGAGLWAQWVEGSPRLARPFGFFGGVLGIVAGSVAARWLGTDPWLMLGAFAVAGPWVQAAGRLRCLVQGCCHGSPAPPRVGIRYTHARSRVTRLSDLGGVPVHPTPLYSILWNVPIAAATARLWSLGAPLDLVGAVYLVLTGLGRFVEEAYRGEPQTPVWRGLRLYQWVSIVTLVAGVLVVLLGDSAAAPAPEPSWSAIGIASVLGIVVGVALGVDWPDSNRRFARLA